MTDNRDNRAFITSSKLTVFLYLLYREGVPAERIEKFIGLAQDAEDDKISLADFPTGLKAHYDAQKLINRRKKSRDAKTRELGF